MKTAILFIDGNNLYHNLKNMGIYPGNIDFQKFTDFICRKTSCFLKEVRYYNSMPTIKDGQKLYYSHLKFIDNLKKIPGFTVRTRKLQTHSNKELN